MGMRASKRLWVLVVGLLVVVAFWKLVWVGGVEPPGIATGSPMRPETQANPGRGSALQSTNRIALRPPLQGGSAELTGGVHGRVERNGEWWAGMIAWRRQGGEWGAGRPVRDGAYLLRDLPEGVVEIGVFSKWGAAPLYVRGTVVAPGVSGECDLMWRCSVPRIVAQCTCGDRSQEGVVVVVVSDDGLWTVSGVSGADGALDVEVVDGKAYNVVAQWGAVRVEKIAVRPHETVTLSLPQLGMLKVQCRAHDTGALVNWDVHEPHCLAWRPVGVTEWSAFRARPAGLGEAVARLPLGPVDIGVSMQAGGYQPAMERVVVESGGSTCVVAVRRGNDARIRIEGWRKEWSAEVAVLVLQQERRYAVREALAGDVNLTLNGIEMHVEDPRDMQRILKISDDGVVRLQGLGPGSYELVMLPPGVIAMNPPTFDVPSGQDVVVRASRL